jgi:hypothetical protein
MRRLLIIAYIVFCFEVGVFLFVFPWVSLWGKNYFLDHYALVAGIARNYFLRGAVSGVGLADVWLAFYELWRFRRELGLVGSRPSR